MAQSCCDREYLGAVASDSVTLTATDSQVIVPTADAVGRKYRLESVRIVQGASAVAALTSDAGEDLCPVDVNGVGENEVCYLEDQGCTFDVTGSGNATLTYTRRWL